jgi:hypothetical protein
VYLGIKGQCPLYGLWLLFATFSTASLTLEGLAEKSGLYRGYEMGGPCDTGCGCTSSSSIPDVLRLIAVQMRNDFTCFGGTADEPVLHAKPHHIAFCSQQKHIHHLPEQTLNCIQTIICKLVDGKSSCPF